MNPSWGRCTQAAMLAGVLGFSSVAMAQQSGQPAQSAPAKAQPAGDAKKAVAKSEAAQRKAAAKAPAKDPAAAQAEIEAGVGALAQGRPDSAVTSLSNGLAAGSLPQAQTARALYYRGVAYRRVAKPAQAISDLTSALWIKGGLTEEQRVDALQQRSAAYREAGLPDQAEPPGARSAGAAGKTGGGAGAAAVPFSTVAPPAPNVSSTSVAGAGSFFSALFGGSSSSSSSTATSAAPAQPVPKPQPQAAPTTTASVPARAPGPLTSGAAAAAPAQSAPSVSDVGAAGKPATRLVPVQSNATSLPVGFQDMGSGIRYVEVSTQAPNRAAQAAPAEAVQPQPETPTKGRPGAAATARPAAAKAAVPAEPQQKVAALQSNNTSTANNTSATAPATARGRSAGGPAQPAGTVQVQVAAVRSAEEAQSVAARLQKEYARDLGGRAPVVGQISAGNLGTFYRVQVGPFATARDTEGLCARLKSGGLDCRVVAQ